MFLHRFSNLKQKGLQFVSHTISGDDLAWKCVEKQVNTSDVYKIHSNFDLFYTNKTSRCNVMRRDKAWKSTDKRAREINIETGLKSNVSEELKAGNHRQKKRKGQRPVEQRIVI